MKNTFPLLLILLFAVAAALGLMRSGAKPMG
jgi:hypothetical protein